MTPLDCPLGRVENSKTFQNQMSQCFFIGDIDDIESGDDFYFNQKKFWWVEMDFKKKNYKGKMAKMSPKITKIENWNVVQKQALLPYKPMKKLGHLILKRFAIFNPA